MEKLILTNPIWDEVDEFDTIDELTQHILENFVDEEDGIHPDIEDLIITKRTHKVVVQPNNEEETFTVKIREIKN